MFAKLVVLLMLLVGFGWAFFLTGGWASVGVYIAFLIFGSLVMKLIEG